MADEQPAAKASWIPTVTGRIFGLAIVIGAIVLGLYVLRLYYIYPRTDDAYVRANIVGIAPHVSGPIVELADSRQSAHCEGRAALRGRSAALPGRRSTAPRRASTLTNLQIDALQNAIHSAQARQQQLEADAAYDKQYLDRIVPLLTRHFVTANDVFNARSRLAAARGRDR